MKQVLISRTFKRDLKRLARCDKSVGELLAPVIDCLQLGKPLPQKWLDHGLGAGWPDHRDLHLKPDLLVVYTRPCPNSVKLVRIGNHANLQLT
ncbi:type II toxin-antitoxin system YafQ family toxin [Salmonella enterica]|nr:type II toxin-antitoxin system YafQ family toxin [Salmonella enterica]EFO7976637.1 type II toxin-antitoxin system YafQ family toxin [Salmonella enterica]EGC0267594.1 type II toxin-antitoxin system YafQ family toxin [Salmonella enterica]